MKKIKYFILISLASLSLFSCNKDGDDEITDSQIIEGLKEALKVGTDSASGRLSANNGYFKDQAVKLLLPEEISNSIAAFKGKSITVLGVDVTGEDIYSNGLNIPSIPFVSDGINIAALSSKEDDLVLGINRAAETAAKDAGPIFWDAITGMSIADGNSILFGGVDDAATTYLDGATRTSLFEKFEPKIDAALSSVKVGDKSVVNTYESYISDYNAILNTPAGLETIGSLMDINTVQADDLSAYSTDKGLTGLFLKVADEEKNIRTNPLHRVTEILETIFGQLD